MKVVPAAAVHVSCQTVHTITCGDIMALMGRLSEVLVALLLYFATLLHIGLEIPHGVEHVIILVADLVDDMKHIIHIIGLLMWKDIMG